MKTKKYKKKIFNKKKTFNKKLFKYKNFKRKSLKFKKYNSSRKKYFYKLLKGGAPKPQAKPPPPVKPVQLLERRAATPQPPTHPGYTFPVDKPPSPVKPVQLLETRAATPQPLTHLGYTFPVYKPLRPLKYYQDRAIEPSRTSLQTPRSSLRHELFEREYNTPPSPFKDPAIIKYERGYGILPEMIPFQFGRPLTPDETMAKVRMNNHTGPLNASTVYGR